MQQSQVAWFMPSDNIWIHCMRISRASSESENLNGFLIVCVPAHSITNRVSCHLAMRTLRDCSIRKAIFNVIGSEYYPELFMDNWCNCDVMAFFVLSRSLRNEDAYTILYVCCTWAFVHPFEWLELRAQQLLYNLGCCRIRETTLNVFPKWTKKKDGILCRQRLIYDHNKNYVWRYVISWWCTVTKWQCTADARESRKCVCMQWRHGIVGYDASRAYAVCDMMRTKNVCFIKMLLNVSVCLCEQWYDKQIEMFDTTMHMLVAVPTAIINLICKSP